MALIDDLKTEVTTLLHHTAITPTLLNGFVKSLEAILYSRRNELFDASFIEFTLPANTKTLNVSSLVDGQITVESLNATGIDNDINYLNPIEFYEELKRRSGTITTALYYYTIINVNDAYTIKFLDSFGVDVQVVVMYFPRFDALVTEHRYFKENYNMYLYGVLSLAFLYLQSIGTQSANEAFKVYTALYADLLEARKSELTRRYGSTKQKVALQRQYSIDRGV
jgi:hypothetical protein